MAEYTGFNDRDGDEIWSDSIVLITTSYQKNTLISHSITKVDDEYGISYSGLFISLLNHATDYEIGTSKPFVKKNIPSLTVIGSYAEE